METFDGVGGGGRTECCPDRIDDAFQPPAARSLDRPGANAGFERKSLTQCITQGIWNALC